MMRGQILIAWLFLTGSMVAQDTQREIEAELNQRLFINDVVKDDGWQGLLRTPTAIYYDPTGDEVFVADAGNNRVLVYYSDLTPKYTFQHFIRDERTGEMVPGEPKDMVVNSLGEIIMIDARVEYLEVLDFRGKPLERISPAGVLGDSTLQVRAQGLAIDERHLAEVVPRPTPSAPFFALSPWWQEIRTMSMLKTAPLTMAMVTVWF